MGHLTVYLSWVYNAHRVLCRESAMNVLLGNILMVIGVLLLIGAIIWTGLAFTIKGSYHKPVKKKRGRHALPFPVND